MAAASIRRSGLRPARDDGKRSALRAQRTRVRRQRRTRFGSRGIALDFGSLPLCSLLATAFASPFGAVVAKASQLVLQIVEFLLHLTHLLPELPLHEVRRHPHALVVHSPPEAARHAVARTFGVVLALGPSTVAAPVPRTAGCEVHDHMAAKRDVQRLLFPVAVN